MHFERLSRHTYDGERNLASDEVDENRPGAAVRHLHEVRQTDAITALPQPDKVSQNVPMASAISFCDCILASLICRAFGANRGAPAFTARPSAPLRYAGTLSN